VGRTSLDAYLLVVQRKRKSVQCLAEEKKKAILKVKNENRKAKRKRSRTYRQVQEGGCTLLGSSSKDMKDTSNDEDHK